MEHFTFGRNNGLRVSALALGAGMFGSRWGYGADPDDVPKMFERFAEAGGTFIDTAASYQFGEAEENVGRLLDGRRDSFTIATKFAIGGPEGDGVLQTGNGRRAMFRSVEGSLRRLGTDYIDLLWVHFPDLVTPLEEIVRGLDDLARAGKILYAGLSNFPAWMTSRAATLAELGGLIPVSGVQLEYSLVERSADRESLPMAEAMGLGAALWSPLGGGVLSGKYRSGTAGRLTDWDRLVHTEDKPVKAATVDTVLVIAGEIGVPAAQVAVGWLLERARRSSTGLVPVIGPRTVEQTDSYLAALDVKFDGDQYRRLEQVSRIDLGQPHDQIAEGDGGAGRRYLRIHRTRGTTGLGHRGRKRLSQQGALAVEKRLRHFGFRHDPVEAVERARDDLDLAPHACRLQPLGVREVFVVKQVQRADTQPRGRQPAEVLAPRRNGHLRIRTAEVRGPTEFVTGLVPQPQPGIVQIFSVHGAVVEHRIHQ